MGDLDWVADKMEAGNPDKHEMHGIRRLAAAALVQAISDLRGGSAFNQRNAVEWFEQGNVGGLSFKTCCEILGRDPETVRSNLLTDYGVPRAFLTFGPLTEEVSRIA